jgi:hypothetical protein
METNPPDKPARYGNGREQDGSNMIKQSEDYDDDLEGICDSRTSIRISKVHKEEDEVLALTWAVLDGVATEVEKERLSHLIQSAYEHRSSFLQAMALSRDLTSISSYDDQITSGARRTTRGLRAS